uniref:BHLH domain-containing protein n=1 Tax=Schistosoma haematobium TaxID=6185 RepID=A0A095C4R6_SCHHA
MAKQMTERKRRDRINALLDNLRTLILKLLHKNVSSDLLLISVSSSTTTIFNLSLLNQLFISYNMFTFNDIRY